MASNWISDPQWDQQNRPYVEMLMDGPGYKKGDRRYIAPAEVWSSNSYGEDPRLMQWADANRNAPGQSLLRERGQWNPRTGKWDQGVNWTNIASMAVGGAMAAPFVVPAVSSLISGAGAEGAAAPLLTNTATPGMASIVPTGAMGAGTAAIPTAASAALPAVTSAAVPTLASAALPGAVADFTSGVVGTLPAVGPTAGEIATALAIPAATTAPVVANMIGPEDPYQPEDTPREPDATKDSTPRTGEPGSRPLPEGPDIINGPGMPPLPDVAKPAFKLPLGITMKDILDNGLGFLNQFLNRNAQQDQSEARAAADKAALDFAMAAYREQMDREKERWDANEARRVPYRRASADTLAEFRRLLGLGD